MRIRFRYYLILAGGVAFVLAGILLIATGKSYQVKPSETDDPLEAPLYANGSIPCNTFLRYAQDEEAIRIDYSGNLKFALKYDPAEIRPGQGLYIRMTITYPQEPDDYKVFYITKQGEQDITGFINNPDQPTQLQGNLLTELSEILKKENFKDDLLPEKNLLDALKYNSSREQDLKVELAFPNLNVWPTEPKVLKSEIKWVVHPEAATTYAGLIQVSGSAEFSLPDRQLDFNHPDTGQPAVLSRRFTLMVPRGEEQIEVKLDVRQTWLKSLYGYIVTLVGLLGSLWTLWPMFKEIRRSRAKDVS